MIVETTPGCSRTPLVLFALEETGRRYTVQPRAPGWFDATLGGPGPLLVDGDLALAELDTILRYVCAGTALAPQDASDRARVERWMELMAARLRPAVARVAAIRAQGSADAGRLREELGSIGACLAALEAAVTPTGYLVGALTAADLPLVQVPALAALGVDLAPFPRVVATAEALRARPAWARANTAMMRGPAPARPLTDRLGNNLTTGSADAALRYSEALDRVAALDEGAGEALAAALSADQGLAVAHALGALLAVMEGRPPEAFPRVARARALAEAASAQERRQVALVGGFLARDPGLHAAVEAHLSDYPRDLLAVLVGGFALTFTSGRLDRDAAALAFLGRAAPAFEGDWTVASLQAFVEEEAFLFASAERRATAALARHARAGFAVHALAHVGWERQELDATVHRLCAFVDDIGQRAPFRCHFTWHAAICALAGGDIARVRALYDAEIDPRVGHPRALVDAASLAWRLRLAGAPEPEWEPIRALATAAAANPGSPMVDTWVALAFAGAGDGEGLDRLATAEEALTLRGSAVAGLAVLPLALGLSALLAGRWSESADLLAQADRHKARVGMSHAQGELVEDLYVRACEHAGRGADVAARRDSRRARRASALRA